VDLMIYMNGSFPVSVHAAAMSDPQNLDDTVNISLIFENGSIGTISYFANGSKTLPKEYFEAYRGGVTGVLSDFREMTIYGSGKPVRKKLLNQDKGQQAMVAAFVAAIKNQGESPIPFAETYVSTAAIFATLRSLQTRQAVAIEKPAFG